MTDTHWIALSLVPKIGTKTLNALMEQLGSAEAALQADMETLMQVRGIGRKTATAIATIDLDWMQQQIGQWQAQQVTIIPSYTADYPAILKTLDDAPPTLFVRGTLAPQFKGAALVGTRSPTGEARQIAFELGQRLTAQGWTIVSGLALGIDTAAHEGALSVDDGKTIAVLGSGVLNIYPEQNQALADDIMQRGALVGENHPLAQPKVPHLVSRNRMISGLCQHVIVVETGAEGGAMYAAKFAQQQGRTLHAVGLPASGNLQLLKDKACYIAPDLQDFSLG